MLTTASVRLTLAASVLALAMPVFAADPPTHIVGVYSRMSRTCGGGPGFADSDRPITCTSVFQDTLEIARSIHLDTDVERSSSNNVYISFGLHFDYMDYCAFKGHGTWANGIVVIHHSEKPLDPACRLKLIFRKGAVRLSDPGGKCSPSLCTAAQKLDGVSYKRQAGEQ